MRMCPALTAILLSSALTLSTGSVVFADAPATRPARQESAEGITHAFLSLGAETYIAGADGVIRWSYPANTRDGWVLPSGNVLLAVSKGKDFPGGGVVEVTREGKVVS